MGSQPAQVYSAFKFVRAKSPHYGTTEDNVRSFPGSRLGTHRLDGSRHPSCLSELRQAGACLECIPRREPRNEKWARCTPHCRRVGSQPTQVYSAFKFVRAKSPHYGATDNVARSQAPAWERTTWMAPAIRVAHPSYGRREPAWNAFRGGSPGTRSGCGVRRTVVEWALSPLKVYIAFNFVRAESPHYGATEDNVKKAVRENSRTAFDFTNEASGLLVVQTGNCWFVATGILGNRDINRFAAGKEFDRSLIFFFAFFEFG